MEAYSPRMLAALTATVQQADAGTLLQLLAGLRQRGGPGLALVEAELRDRGRRGTHNYPTTYATTTP